MNDIATEAENAVYRNDLRGVYAVITKLTSLKPNIPPLKDKNGSVLKTDDQQVQRRKEFFEDNTAPEEEN